MGSSSDSSPPQASENKTRWLTVVSSAVLLTVTLLVGYRIVSAGVGLSDDSFLYISRGLGLKNDFAFSHLKPGWFPSAYGALLGLFLSVDRGPIGAASWANAALLVVLAWTLFRATSGLTGSTLAGLALALSALGTRAVTWPFQWAWSEPLFLTLSAVHLYGLVKYTMTRKLAFLAVFGLSGSLLIWTRYAGLAVVAPMGLFAAWDLYTTRQHRLRRTGIYLAALALFSLVPLWSPGRFTEKLGSQSMPGADTIAEILTGPVWNMLVATRDAVGGTLFLALVASALAWTARSVWSRHFREEGKAPTLQHPLSDEGKGRLVVLCYAMTWMLAVSAVTIEHLVEVTVPDQPINPFIELRFAAPHLPWLLVSLAALWGLARHAVFEWPVGPSVFIPGVASVVLVGTLATEHATIGSFLAPGGTVFPTQYGYAREHRDDTAEITAFLTEAARREAPLFVVPFLPPGDAILPRDYFRSIVYLPHSPATQPSEQRLTVRRHDGRVSSTHRIQVGRPSSSSTGSTVVHYTDSAWGLPPDGIIEHLAAGGEDTSNRFVIVTLVRQQLESDLAPFGQMGYHPVSAIQTGMVAWILFERG